MVAAAAMLIAALAGSLLAVSPATFLRSVGIILVTAVAGGAGGAAIGFLFGIPRVLTDASVAPPAVPIESDAADDSSAAEKSEPAPRRLLASNSNLEQVSDWLTKIILGLGLTQLYKLNDLLLDFTRLVSGYVPPADRTTPLIATVMLVFAIIVGFLAMYLETRLVLSRIFNSVESILANLQKQNKKITVAKEAAESLASNLHNVVLNFAQGAAGDPATFAAAADSLKSAASSGQGDPELRSLAAQALAASGRTVEAGELVASTSVATVRDQLTRMMLALYDDPPAGFRKTLRIAAELGGSDAARGNPEYWFYQAAALGQQYRYMRDQLASQDELRSLRDNAFASASRAIALDPGYRTRVSWLLNPEQSPTPGDDDLSVFNDDAEFQALVRG